MASKLSLIELVLFASFSIIVHGQGKIVNPSPKDTVPHKVDSLRAAIVVATMRPHMRGDTLEYNTEHLQTRPNSIVEELLRRLPGLHVDADGSIVYNGEKIQHLLVDGQDIFGSDPTLVTRSFDANKIARVQILDRRSDQAVFTGVDDGVRVKTLNLVLKESAKNGYFGRAEGGGSAEGLYAIGGALAAFRDKEQLTVLGLSSNTGVLAFSNNGGNMSPGAVIAESTTDPLGASAGSGIPHSTAAGFHYANQWNGQEGRYQINYQYGRLWTHPITSTQTTQTQADSIYYQQQQSQSINEQQQHRLDLLSVWQLSSRSALKFQGKGRFTQAQNQFEDGANGNFNESLVNSSLRNIQDHSSRQLVAGDLSWRFQPWRQTNRVFNITAGLQKDHQTTNGNLHAISQFFQANGSDVDTVDERKIFSTNGVKIWGGVSYTQPIFKGATLSLAYNVSLLNDHPLQNTFSRGDGKYDEIVDSLTSNLKTKTINKELMIIIQGKFGHFGYILTMDQLDYNYRQQDLQTNSIIRLRSIDWSPRARLSYRVSPLFAILLNYGVMPQLPNPAQLVPIKNNSDPLHLAVGNPDLVPGTIRKLDVEFHLLKAWMSALKFTINSNSNALSTRTITDSLGRQVSQPVNVSGGGGEGVNFSLNHTLGGIDWNFNAVNSFNRTINYVDADLNKNDNYTVGGGIGATKYLADKFSFQVNTNVTYFYSKNSINSTTPLHYWVQSHSALVAFFFVPHYEFGTNGVYSWQQKTSAFSASTSVLLLNAYCIRNFMHDKFSTKILFNNILNQNSGISRTNLGNINTQTATNILGRYWMLSVIYHFDRKFKNK